ncbi:MAG: 16S rRNA (uracil(1498)-N(3))-methyltransferase [Paludibacter sp.]|nr:16S rRNA (uracil(1498)-N(3))-methyltransferase [Paludibacter sp.]
MHSFYVPDITAGVLPEEESLHAAKVLRLKEGDLVVLLDGKGGVYEAEITIPHPKKCGFLICKTEQRTSGRDYRLHVAIAPTKNIDRFEWFIEKAVEIGVDEISPILCRYSERKQLKPERVEKIMIAASKQSIQSVFPILHPLTTFSELITSSKESLKCIAHCYPQDKTELKVALKGQQDLLILIGPEGDFSQEEVEAAIGKGFIPVSLSNSRLRTETAGLMVCATAALCK